MLTISFSICREEQKSPQHPDVGVWSCVQSEVVVHLAGVSLSDRVLSREDVFNSLSTCQSDMLYYCAAPHRYCSGGTGVKALFDSLKQTKSRKRHFCSPVQKCLYLLKILGRKAYKFGNRLPKTWEILTHDFLRNSPSTLSLTQKTNPACKAFLIWNESAACSVSCFVKIVANQIRSVLRI